MGPPVCVDDKEIIADLLMFYSGKKSDLYFVLTGVDFNILEYVWYESMWSRCFHAGAQTYKWTTTNQLSNQVFYLYSNKSLQINLMIRVCLVTGGEKTAL